MADGVGMTVTGLTELRGTFEAAGRRTVPVVEGIVAKGAVNIKKDARRRISGLAHAPAYPFTIGYDQWHLPGQVGATIGPDKDRRQGALGNLLEYGSVNNAPHPHLSPALDAEAPRFERALADQAQQLLDGGS